MYWYVTKTPLLAWHYCKKNLPANLPLLRSGVSWRVINIHRILLDILLLTNSYFKYHTPRVLSKALLQDHRWPPCQKNHKFSTTLSWTFQTKVWDLFINIVSYMPASENAVNWQVTINLTTAGRRTWPTWKRSHGNRSKWRHNTTAM